MAQWTSEEATRELLVVLPFLNRLMAAELRQAVGEDTTMPQFRVLAHLTEEPLTVSMLARLRRVSLQAAGELVNILVERGWIARMAHPEDRRQQLLVLTEEGRSRYQNAQESMSRRLVPLIDNLDDNEMEAVQVAFTALHRVLARELEGQEAE